MKRTSKYTEFMEKYPKKRVFFHNFCHFFGIKRDIVKQMKRSKSILFHCNRFTHMFYIDYNDKDILSQWIIVWKEL